jgi:hypothetical protein
MEPYDEHDDDLRVGPPLDGDAIEHLWNAAHELLRAVRMVIDAADEFVETQRAAMNRHAQPGEHAPERESRVRHIDIDAREGADSPGERPPAPGASGTSPR